MTKTKIEWADRVWNPVTGCTKVSEGCRNCYAERMAKRLAGRFGYPADDPFKVTLHRDRLDQPLRWTKPWMVFVCSMGDLFHKDVPWGFIGMIWMMMERCPQHTFLILTKRPEQLGVITRNDGLFPTLPNVWLGVSVEDQATADERIPLLLQTPAAKRFVSIEPMLGPVDLTRIHHKEEGLSLQTNALSGEVICLNTRSSHRHKDNEVALDWVILGGESGPGARPMHPDWARSVREQCQQEGVPFFFKQWGEWTDEYPQEMSLASREMTFKHKTTFYRIGKKAAGSLLDGREHKELPNGR